MKTEKGWMKWSSFKNESTRHTPLSRKYFTGFTLVELIVVITILVILGTIAFMSLWGYSKNARDSSRVSDIANLSKSLNVAYIQTNSYPVPDNMFAVTYSGANLWYQWTVGDTVMRTMNAGGVVVSKKPTNPSNTTQEYAYSKLANGNGFQIKTEWEGDSISLFNILAPSVYAVGPPSAPITMLSYIKGNYNGMVSKASTGNMIYVVAAPSIMTSYVWTAGQSYEIDANLQNKMFAHGQVGELTYTPQIVYSGTALPRDDGSGAITSMMTNLQSAYTGQNSLSSDIASMLQTPSTRTELLGVNIINSYLWGNAVELKDPYYANVSLLMHFDGANNGTGFTESKGHSVNVFGDAKTITTNKKFGSASISLDGVGDYLSVPSTATSEFNIASNTWTIEFWYYGTPNYMSPFFYGVDASNWSYGARLVPGSPYMQFMYTTQSAVSWGQSYNGWGWLGWHHVAYVSETADASKMRMYYDGVQNATILNLTAAGGLKSILNGTFFIGYDLNNGPAASPAMLIDELRVTKWVARYTSSFTPMGRAFPDK